MRHKLNIDLMEGAISELQDLTNSRADSPHHEQKQDVANIYKQIST